MTTTTIPRGPATTLTTFRGKPVDLVMRAFLEALEARLGYELTVVQGYNPSNQATSAGTHSYGVVDLADYDSDAKVRAANDLGGFFWHRDEIPGLWSPHNHGGIRNHPGLADAAVAQQRDFDAHPPRNGLKGHAVDLVTYHPPKPVQFVYPPKAVVVAPKPTKVTQLRDALVESHQALGTAIALAKDVDVQRVVVRGQVDDLQRARREIGDALDVMPKR
jgi:hypothetical protein